MTGFQLDGRYGLDDYDVDCRRVGLACTGRWAAWSGEPYEGGAYAVSVHQAGPRAGRQHDEESGSPDGGYDRPGGSR